MKKLLYCANLSLLSYNNNNKDFIEDKSTGTHLLYTVKDNDLYIAFRGSESIKDFIIDLQTKQSIVPYNNDKTDIRIHCGFLKAYESVRNKILYLIKKEYNNIYITGHSLGGALAVLAMLDIVYNYHDKLIFVNKKLYCYTFGSPDIGNKAFCDSTDKRCKIYNVDYVNVVNGNDIITKYPIFRDYYKCGQIYNIGKSKWYNKLFGSVNDHKLNNYIEELKDYAE